MSPWRPQLIPFLHYVVRRRSFEETDAAAARELDWRNHADHTLPPGLELRWLGTSGFCIRYGDHAVVLDPYVSRCPLRDVVTRRRLTTSPEGLTRHIGDRVDAIVVGHSHFDHVLDVPALAQRDQARVFGSRSTARLMALHGLTPLTTEVEPYRVYDVGPFSLSFTPSVHSKLMLGLSVPYDGDISCEHLDDLTAGAYHCGQVYGVSIEVAGVRFYHQGSADLIDNAIRDRGVDVFLAGIAGRGFTDRYAERILSRLEPRIVIPHHYDNFFRPLDAPMEFSLNVDLAGFADEVRAVSADFTVLTLSPLDSYGDAPELPGC